MGIVTFRRYTNLTATLDILKNKRITLLSPDTWDDRNDAFFITAYGERQKAGSVLALCFAQSDETYHHWRIFSHGPDGVCIEFEKGPLIEALEQHGIIARPVSYKMIKDLNSSKLITDDLPFLKRYPFKDEKEYRFIWNCDHEQPSKSFQIPLSSIRRITLSPWMPSPLSDTVKEIIKTIDGCENINVFRSTLIENEQWKKFVTQ